MKPQSPHSDYSVVVTMDYDAAGYPQSQIAPMGVGGSNAKAEARHPYGIIGHPADADQDPTTADVTNGAFAQTDKEGSTLHSVAMDDPRVTSMLPQVPKGGSQTYGGQPHAAATVSWAQHDGQGNYAIQVPTDANSIVLTTADGSLLVKLAGGQVQLGDATARALAHAQEVLTALSAISAAFAAMATAMSNNPAVYAAFATAMATPLGTVTSTISAITGSLPTTKAMGT